MTIPGFDSPSDMPSDVSYPPNDCRTDDATLADVAELEELRSAAFFIAHIQAYAASGFAAGPGHSCCGEAVSNPENQQKMTMYPLEQCEPMQESEWYALPQWGADYCDICLVPMTEEHRESRKHKLAVSHDAAVEDGRL